MRCIAESAALVLCLLCVRAWVASSAVAQDLVEAVPETASGPSDETTDQRVGDSQADLVESVEDVTEAVQSDAGSDAIESVQPAAVNDADAFELPRVSLNGWLRQSLEWTFNDEGYRTAAPDPLSLPRDRLLSRSQLLLRANYRKGGFEAGVSGLLGVVVHEQGTADGRPFTGINGQSTTARVEAELRDAYLGLGAGPLDLRIGQQRVAWGRSDVFAPNDIVNARDLRDPLLGDPELRYLPTPLLRVSLSFDSAIIEGFVAPVFVPDRFELFGSNWGPLSLDSPPALRGFFNQLRNAVDPSLQGEVANLLQQTRLPSAFGDATSAGVKLGATLFGVDLDAYYQYGYDGTPYVQTDDSFRYLLEHTDFANSKFADLAPLLRALDAGLVPFRAEFLRRHHVGVDAATTLGPFVLRIDAAYESGRVFYAADFSSFISRALLAVAGIEFQTGELDEIIELELIYIGMLDQPGVQPLGYAPNTYAAALVARWPLFDPISVNIRAVGGIAPRSYVLQPALRVTRDAFSLDLGLLVTGGDAYSIGWIFRRNAGVFVQARYAL